MDGRSGRRYRCVEMLLGVIAALAVMAFAPTLASAEKSTAPTLSGQALLAGTPFPPGTVDVTASCNEDGTGTIDFTIAGPTGPPYAGTFTAEGTAVLGEETPVPDFPGVKSLVSVTETFTIDSPVGLVEGEKTLAAVSLGGRANIGVCGTHPTASFLTLHDVEATMRYSAFITTPTGDRFFDQGFSVLNLFERVGRTDPVRFPLFQRFSEFFISDYDTAQPCKDKEGTEKDKCKDKAAKK